MKRIPTDRLLAIRNGAKGPQRDGGSEKRAMATELLACREERDSARALLELVAGNLANFAAKREEAPASAEAHLDEAMEALVAYQPKDGYGEAAKALRLDLWREGPMRALQDERDAARAEAEELRAELAAVKRQRDELVAAAPPVLSSSGSLGTSPPLPLPLRGCCHEHPSCCRRSALQQGHGLLAR